MEKKEIKAEPNKDNYEVENRKIIIPLPKNIKLKR